MDLPTWLPSALAYVVILAASAGALIKTRRDVRADVDQRIRQTMQDNAEGWESRANLLQQTLDDAHAAIAELKEKVAALDRQRQADHAAHQQQVSEKDATIATLQARTAELERELATVHAESDERAAHLERAFAEIAELRQQLSAYTTGAHIHLPSAQPPQPPS